jgi:hypothetical protein
MAYLIAATKDHGDDFLTVNSLFVRLRRPDAPKQLAFPSLPGASTPLVTGVGSAIQFDGNERVVRAVGLSTCASVVFLNATQGRAYVYHAPSGTVSSQEFGYARQAAGGGLDSLYVVLAHVDGPSGYEKTLGQFEDWGVPANQMVEISNLGGTSFGLNNMLQLGY